MARLIDADKADVENIYCYYGSNCYVEDVQAWLDKQPAVDAVPVIHGRWIPVEERLPGNEEKVLVWWATPYGECYDILRFATCLEDADEVDFEGQKHGGFYFYDSEYGFCESRDVTHWMPLPEPPKEE